MIELMKNIGLLMLIVLTILFQKYFGGVESGRVAIIVIIIITIIWLFSTLELSLEYLSEVDSYGIVFTGVTVGVILLYVFIVIFVVSECETVQVEIKKSEIVLKDMIILDKFCKKEVFYKKISNYTFTKYTSENTILCLENNL